MSGIIFFKCEKANLDLTKWSRPTRSKEKLPSSDWSPKRKIISKQNSSTPSPELQSLSYFRQTFTLATSSVTVKDPKRGCYQLGINLPSGVFSELFREDLVIYFAQANTKTETPIEKIDLVSPDSIKIFMDYAFKALSSLDVTNHEKRFRRLELENSVLEIYDSNPLVKAIITDIIVEKLLNPRTSRIAAEILISTNYTKNPSVELLPKLADLVGSKKLSRSVRKNIAWAMLSLIQPKNIQSVNDRYAIFGYALLAILDAFPPGSEFNERALQELCLLIFPNPTFIDLNPEPRVAAFNRALPEQVTGLVNITESKKSSNPNKIKAIELLGLIGSVAPENEKRVIQPLLLAARSGENSEIKEAAFIALGKLSYFSKEVSNTVFDFVISTLENPNIIPYAKIEPLLLSAKLGSKSDDLQQKVMPHIMKAINSAHDAVQENGVRAYIRIIDKPDSQAEQSRQLQDLFKLEIFLANEDAKTIALQRLEELVTTSQAAAMATIDFYLSLAATEKIIYNHYKITYSLNYVLNNYKSELQEQPEKVAGIQKALIRIVETNHNSTRDLALDSLGELARISDNSRQQIEDLFLKKSNSENNNERRLAAVALGRIGFCVKSIAAIAIPPLASMVFKDADSKVQEAAIKALNHIAPTYNYRQIIVETIFEMRYREEVTFSQVIIFFRKVDEIKTTLQRIANQSSNSRYKKYATNFLGKL